jgi:transcriptional regulator with XRE-family HTH domain
MKSTRNKIKILRDQLDLSQADFATALGVTQATVARWEAEKNATQPTGDAARRLEHLEASMANPEESKKLQEMLCAVGGVSALAALLTLGSSIGAAAGVLGIVGLFGPVGIAGGAAAGLLYRFLQRAQSDRHGEQKGKRK